MSGSSSGLFFEQISKDTWRLLSSLRKQPTFLDNMTGFPGKWRPRNECRIPNFRRVTAWVILLVSRGKFRTMVDSISSTFQICMGSDTSSWKFYALSSEVISADFQAASQLFCIWQFGAYGQPLTPIGWKVHVWIAKLSLMDELAPASST